MPSVMLRFSTRVASAFAVASLCALAPSSCSEPVNDSLGRACEVIVGCGVDISKGDCIDVLGGAPPTCTDCIENSACDEYSSCQRDPGCRIPPELLPE